MPIYAESKGVTRELVPIGNHRARCVKMIQIGTIEETDMAGKRIRRPKVNIGWELVDELRVFDEKKGEQPMMISQMFTLSMHEKSTLRKIVVSWRGKDFSDEEAKKFDITKLLGVPCMINVSHKKKNDGGLKQQIDAVTSVPKMMQKDFPAQINPSQMLSFLNWDESLYESLPEWMRDLIRSSEEYQALKSPKGEVQISSRSGSDFPPHIESPNDNDLPF